MLVAILMLIFTTVMLLFYSLIVSLTTRESAAKRLQAFVDENKEIVIEETNKKQGLQPLKIIGRQLERIKSIKRITERTSKLLIQADVPITGEELAFLQTVSSCVLCYLVFLVSKDVVISFVLFILIWVMPVITVKRLKEKRVKKFNDQLGDALVIFSNSLKAGYSYLQAVGSVAKEMPDPISKEFTRVLKEMSFGLDANKTLMNLLKRVDSDDLKLMVTAIVIQKETGGNLAEILDNIADTIRDRVRLQGEVKTLTAQGRISGIIVSLLPIVLGMVLYMMNKEYILVLTTDVRGMIMLGVAATSELLGIIIIQKIVKIEV